MYSLKKWSKKDENVLFVNDFEILVKDLISNTGKGILLVGGSKITSNFLNIGLVNEIIITIISVVLGTGTPLSMNIPKETKFELIKTTDYGILVELYYKILK